MLSPKSSLSAQSRDLNMVGVQEKVIKMERGHTGKTLS